MRALDELSRDEAGGTTGLLVGMILEFPAERGEVESVT